MRKQEAGSLAFGELASCVSLSGGGTIFGWLMMWVSSVMGERWRDFDLHMSAKWFNFASGLPHEDKGGVASLRDLTLLL